MNSVIDDEYNSENRVKMVVVNDSLRRKTQEPKIYSCGEYDCGKQFKNKYNLLNHMNQVHLQIRKFACHLCSYKSGQKNSVVSHKLAMHRNGIRHLKCPHCPKTYKWNADLRRHMEKHSSKKFKCEECESQYTEKRYLQIHVKTVHLKVMIKCRVEKCDFEDPRLQKLKEHRLKCHDVANKFKCKFCFYETVRKSDLSRHQNEKHLKVKEYQCSQCEFLTSRKYNLTQHQKSLHKSCETSK